MLEIIEGFEIFWKSLDFGGPIFVCDVWPHGLEGRDCRIGRTAQQHPDAVSDTVVGGTVPWLMEDVMPGSSGREFYTVWFHIDKVSFYLGYKIVQRHLAEACLDFLIVGGNAIPGSVDQKKPRRSDCPPQSTSAYYLWVSEAKAPKFWSGTLWRCPCWEEKDSESLVGGKRQTRGFHCHTISKFLPCYAWEWTWQILLKAALPSGAGQQGLARARSVRAAAEEGVPGLDLVSKKNGEKYSSSATACDWGDRDQRGACSWENSH